MMNGKTDFQIRSILDLADQLIALSEQGFLFCDDDGCVLLNGLVRECAYRIRDAAELERDIHRAQKVDGRLHEDRSPMQETSEQDEEREQTS